MNTEITLRVGIVFFAAIVFQQIFIIYAIYRIFVRSNDEGSVREKILGVLEHKFSLGEISADEYQKLKQDFTSLRV